MTDEERKHEARIEGHVMKALENAYERALLAAADDAVEAALGGYPDLYAVIKDGMDTIADRMLEAEKISDRAFRRAREIEETRRD